MNVVHQGNLECAVIKCHLYDTVDASHSCAPVVQGGASTEQIRTSGGSRFPAVDLVGGANS